MVECIKNWIRIDRDSQLSILILLTEKSLIKGGDFYGSIQLYS